MDLVVFVSSYYIEWDVNIVPVNVELNHPLVLKAMGTINHAFMSKSAIITYSLKKVCMIKINTNKVLSVSKVYNNLHNMPQPRV
jgi:hypothetical protein